MSGKAPGRAKSGVVAVLAAMALGSCGGDGGGDAREEGKRFGESAAKSESPRPFVEHFERITGVRLKPVGGDLFGTRLEVPAKPNRFERFGAYSLVWTRDEKRRELFLGRTEPDDDGIYWRRVGSSYSASKPFGENLVVRWVGRQEKETNEQWNRLIRAVEASLEGTLGSLPKEEQPCDQQDLDPLRGATGECSVRGLPVAFVNADQTLSVPVLEARVLGFGYAEELRNPGIAPLRPRGRFLIVAYRVKNVSSAPISFLQPELRLGGRKLPESPDAAAMLPRSRPLPLPPGATVDARAAFDVDESIDPAQAALILPAEREGKREPSRFLGEGWIRLAKAPPRLPRSPRGKPAGDPSQRIPG